MASSYTENPFASTHTLENPFDDPPPPSSTARTNDLAAREAELQRREQALKQREEHVQRHGRSNWPPFYPLIFHSIPDEIPEASRGMVNRLYQLWLVLLPTLVVNCIACLFLLTAGTRDGSRDFGGSLGYLIFIPPLSFLLWYRPIYNGYMKEQSLYYYMYFFFGGWHVLFCIYMVIGLPSTGSAGIVQMISSFSQKHIVAGVLGAVATFGWVVEAAGNAWYFREIWRHHNSAGHSLTKAKTELATHGAKAYFTRG